MAWVHRITNIDLDLKTAECSACGPVKIQKNTGKYYRCINAAREINRRKKYKKRYGINALELDKPNKCEICGGIIRIAYDHCHKTGKFRGWLCMKCNTAIGLLNDDVQLLEKVIAYLKK